MIKGFHKPKNEMKIVIKNIYLVHYLYSLFYSLKIKIQILNKCFFLYTKVFIYEEIFIILIITKLSNLMKHDIMLRINKQ